MALRRQRDSDRLGPTNARAHDSAPGVFQSTTTGTQGNSIDERRACATSKDAHRQSWNREQALPKTRRTPTSRNGRRREPKRRLRAFVSHVHRLLDDGRMAGHATARRKWRQPLVFVCAVARDPAAHPRSCAHHCHPESAIGAFVLIPNPARNYHYQPQGDRNPERTSSSQVQLQYVLDWICHE